MSHDIYDFPKRLEYVSKKIEKNKKIIKENKKLLLNFHKFCVAEGLSPARTTRCLYALEVFAEWIKKKDFRKCKKKDIIDLVATLEKSDYAYTTKQEMKITLRKFFKWLRGKDECPKEVKWFKCYRTLSNRKLPEELLSENEVKALIDSANSARDKALIAVLYESGVRVGELLSLKMKNINFDEYGAQLLVDGKTGMRQVRIIASVPYLTEWINEHPQKDNPDTPLWLLEKKIKELTHNDIQRILRKIKKKSGIKKMTNAHNFRHSRATFLASFLTDAQMKEYFGWAQSSKMASVYIHMNGKNVDNALLKLNNVKLKEDEKGKEETNFTQKKCGRCGEINMPTDKFCFKCGMVLDKKTMEEILEKDVEREKADRVLDKLIEDPTFKEMFLKKIKEII
jgi:site-specific recombinase XerD